MCCPTFRINKKKNNNLLFAPVYCRYVTIFLFGKAIYEKTPSPHKVIHTHPPIGPSLSLLFSSSSFQFLDFLCLVHSW